ncbi:MAG TPA: YIP1 family protein [Methanosarcinales archaeon]|nr:YIP1 family protein [Methanosarcinales archaeon]
MSNITDMLTNPDRFFAELSQRDVNLRTPFVIVLITAIVGAICTMITYRVMTSSYPAEISAIFGALSTFSTISSLITPFISWVIYAVVFYAVSMLFKGEGSFERVFELVGYGFVPMIIASVVGLVTTMILAPAFGSPFGNPELLQQTMMQRLSMYSPAMTVSASIQFLLWLWGVVIWIFAVKHARNLGTGHAIITVLAVPVAVILVVVIGLICIIAAA